MRERRSIRTFKADPVPRGIVLRLIEAAITAPSASNKQPWKFLIVEGRDVIDDVAGIVRRAVDEVALSVPKESQDAFRAYGDYFTRFEKAPLVIVPIYKPMTILSNLVGPDLPTARRQAISEMEKDSGLAGTAMALQNMLLVAHEMGLGASGMTGPLLAHEELRARLDVPSAWKILALVPVGYPDEIPLPPGRKSVEKVIRWMR
jgi:nitroreductase